MTNPQDSDLPTGTGGVPTPNVSEAANAQPSSQGTSSEDALVEKALAKLAPQIERLVQSTKDKRLKPVEEMAQYIPEMKRMKAYLDAAGGDETKAAREMAIDNLLTGEGSGRTRPPEPPAPDLTPVERATADILRKKGIADNDPEVIELAKKPYTSYADWFEDLVELGNRRAAKPASPPPPVVNDVVGKTPASVEDEAAKLNKIPFGDSRQFYDLAKEQIRKGRR